MKHTKLCTSIYASALKGATIPPPTAKERYSRVANGEALARDSKACSTRALMLISGCSAESANEALHRSTNSGVSMHQILRGIESLGYTATLVPLAHYVKGKTVATIGKALPIGTYLAATAGHVLTLQHGEILDWTEGRRHRIREVYRISKVGDIES